MGILSEKNIGATLRVARRKAGLTQNAVSESLGVSRPTYSYWELGRVTVPTANLYFLSEIYGIPMEAFFLSVDLFEDYLSYRGRFSSLDAEWDTTERSDADCADAECGDPECDDLECDDPECDDPECDDPECGDPEGDDPKCSDPECDNAVSRLTKNEIRCIVLFRVISENRNEELANVIYDVLN